MITKTKNTQTSSGIGFLGLLGILFIGLKLTGYITWSWWLVLLPIYGGIALIFILMFGTLLLLGFFSLILIIIEKWEKYHGR